MSASRRILITGANKGVGLATVAAVLEAADDTFVFLGSRDASRGEAGRDTLVADNPGWAARIEVVAIDVSDDASVEAAAASVAASSGNLPLFGIVNNAGVGLGSGEMEEVLNVNTWGPRRVCRAFLPLLDPAAGRIVNISSASGPNYVATCSPERQRTLTNADVTWEEIEAYMAECLEVAASDGDFSAKGLGDGSAYGLSKACLTAYTMELAREHPALLINACTPGFIETDLTRPYAVMNNVSPEAMGMKPPAEGTRAAMRLLFGDPGGSGRYFGSDAERSPLDRYRSPGDPPFAGD